jgi:hypothetical protein
MGIISRKRIGRESTKNTASVPPEATRVQGILTNSGIGKFGRSNTAYQPSQI